MFKTLRIRTKSSNHPIKLGNGVFKKFIREIKKKQYKKFIIIDSIVYKNFRTFFNDIDDKQISLIKINGSEKIKSIEFYWKIISIILSKKIDRSSCIIAIGGGTIGDLCGFIASTILRSVNFILVPTTLLSQVDSSIGGKNGINSKFGKNQVGTFYQPNMVIIDPLFLKFLSLKQIKSGYVEILKHALINDEKFYQWLKNNYKNLFKLEKNIITYAIERSIKIKAKFILQDEKEVLINSSSRALLNFGHTFGHALESINNYKSNLSHGEAVSIGMIIAAKISQSIGKISKHQLNDIINHFKKSGLSISSRLVKKNKFYKLLVNDKKNQNNKINLILLNKIGNAYYARNFKLIDIRNIIFQT